MRASVLSLLLLGGAMICKAQSGWDYWNLSVLYGNQYQYGQKGLIQDVEILLDRGTKSCLSGPEYYGLAFIQREFNETDERALKAYFNPFHRRLYRVFLGIRIIPHISLEGIKRSEESPNSDESNLYFRPSIGLHTLSFRRSLITWKSYLDIGYASFSAYNNILNRFSVTFKVGIGFNPKGISNLREKQRRKLAIKNL